jgi:hypothetical protein
MKQIVEQSAERLAMALKGQVNDVEPLDDGGFTIQFEFNIDSSELVSRVEQSVYGKFLNASVPYLEIVLPKQPVRSKNYTADVLIIIPWMDDSYKYDKAYGRVLSINMTFKGSVIKLPGIDYAAEVQSLK